MIDLEDVIMGLKCHADNLILKPYDEAYLLGRVREVLAAGSAELADMDSPEVDFVVAGSRHKTAANRTQILNLLLSSYDAAIHRNRELTRAQEDLQRLNARLEAANNELETFSYSVSHDLRAPLRSEGGMEAETAGRNIEWHQGLLPVLRADPGLLRQVLVNLISNAIKYTRFKERAVIEIGTADGCGGDDVIYIRDNGSGFDASQTHRLFGVFKRLHRDDEFEGKGIGLATVQRIINRHGGRIWADGALNRGRRSVSPWGRSRGGESGWALRVGPRGGPVAPARSRSHPVILFHRAQL